MTKVEVIRSAPEPRNVSELQAWLGLYILFILLHQVTPHNMRLFFDHCHTL